MHSVICRFTNFQFKIKFSAWSCAIRRSCVIEWLVIDLLRERQMFFLYQRFFWRFQSWLLEHADCYILCENRTEIFIKHFLPFRLFGYKWDPHEFLKARVRYWPVDSYFSVVVSFLKDRGLTSAFFNWPGKFSSVMHWLKFCKIKLGKIQASSLIILKGISSDCADFEVSKLLTSFSVSSQVTFLKKRARCYSSFLWC